MRGRAGPLDKKPWNQVEPFTGPVEIGFLRQLILGETVAPFRLLDAVTAVIPLYSGRVLDASAASDSGFRHLAAWLRYVEAKWSEHSNRDTEGNPRMTITEQIDYLRKLSAQSAEGMLRVTYNKSGTRLSATTVTDAGAIIDHMAYWAPARSPEEAAYLTAIINSQTVLSKVMDLQPRGEVGRRHFDNLVWTLPIPEYDATDTLHQDLAAAAIRAEAVAASVDLSAPTHFTRKRRDIRDALAADGIAAEIEALVQALLPQ